MAHVRPFRGLRYSASAGPIAKLVAPPYDVLSQAERDEYAARSPHNVVHLTIPEGKSDDRSKFVKYARAAADLAEWRREGVLAPEARPAFYRYTQSFDLPGIEGRFERTSVVALIRVEPYETGVVLPHEQTFPKHKEDRLRILEATRAHLECIFGLYEDPTGEILKTLTAAPAQAGPTVVSDDCVQQSFQPIVDADVCASLARMLADKKVWIADGHHRYETALAFRQALGPRDGEVAEDYMMMALSSMSDPGLVLLPTHRMLREPLFSATELRSKLGQAFAITDCEPEKLMAAIEASAMAGKPAFGVAISGGGGLILTVEDSAKVSGLNGMSGTESLRALDVSTLHGVILEELLNVSGTEKIDYTRDAAEAVGEVAHGRATSFLMNPPSVEDMRRIALGGERMPQKSTFYYPKVLSGLVLWSLNDF